MGEKTDKQAEKIIQQLEKEQLLNELKTTLQDLGRIPRLVMAPVVLYVSQKYDNIPAERKEYLQKIITNLKDKGSGGLNELKTRFNDLLDQ